MRFETVPSVYLEPRILMLGNDVLFQDSVASVLCDVFNLEFFQHEDELFHQIEKDKKIEDILSTCHVQSEDSSDQVSIVHLNYHKLAEKLYAYHRANEFVSTVFMDYMVPKTNGLSIAMKLRTLPISRILLNDGVDNTDVIHALESNIIHKVVHKNDENIVNAIEEVVHQQHANVIQKLNIDLFGRFNQRNPYGKLFSDEAFIAYYEQTLVRKKIVFACVYEAGGSMVMIDRTGSTYLFNIYSSNEIKNVLFESVEFSHSISDVNKKLCREFKLLADYKKNKEGALLDALLSQTLTDTFHSVSVNEETYYITVQKSPVEHNTLQ